VILRTSEVNDGLLTLDDGVACEKGIRAAAAHCFKSFEYRSETKFVFPAAECLENAVCRERRSARPTDDETGSNREFTVQQC
jgi:hypothetical protein